MKIALYILTILYGIYAKKRKNRFEFLFVILSLLLIFYKNSVADYDNYLNVYNYIGSGARYYSTGIGWYWLCNIGNKIGLEYLQFQVVVLLICELIYLKVVKKFTSNRGTDLFFAFYLIYPFFLNLVQFRFFVGTTIILFGYSFLSERDKKGIIIFCISLLISGTIHSSCLFYVVFLFFTLFERIKKAFFGICIAFTVACFILKNYLYTFISLFIDGGRVGRYLLSSDTVGIIGMIAYLATLALLAWLGYRLYEKSKDSEFSEKQANFCITNYYMSNVMFLVFPLTFFDTNFFRVQRVEWILMFIEICMFIGEGQIKFKLVDGVVVDLRRFAVVLSILGFVFYIFWFTPDIVKSFLL